MKTYASAIIAAAAFAASAGEWDTILDPAAPEGCAPCAEGGTPNVIVETAAPFANAGAEQDGRYSVNGTCVFNPADEIAHEGRTYETAGYSLETWNAVSNVWEYLEFRKTGGGGEKFEYTNCLARSLVKLTWFPRLKDGVLRLDEKAYSRHGLAGHWDAIANCGSGAPRSATAAAWKNLAGGADATLVEIDSSNPGRWLPDAYFLAGGDAWKTGKLDLGTNFTIQVSMDYAPEDQTRIWPSPIASHGDKINTYFDKNKFGSTFMADSVVGGNARPWCSPSSWRRTTYTAGVSFEKAFSRTGTSTNAVMEKKGGNWHGKPDPLEIHFGGVPMGGTLEAKLQRSMTGKLHSMRIYRRVLTQHEVEFNELVDGVRFWNRMPAEGFADVAIVRSSRAGVVLPEDGAYLIRGSASKTFAAPEKVSLPSGREYACRGHMLEEFDAEDSQWRFVGIFEGARARSATIAADGGKARRLTWLWEETKSLRTAADWTADDYVAAGLLAHYDAPSNRGTDRPHDPASLLWDDLCGAADMKIYTYGNGHESVYAGDAATKWSGGKAYRARADGYMRMSAPLPLGNAMTIDVALDVDFAAQTSAYPVYFTLYGDNEIFTRGKGSEVEWMTERYTGVASGETGYATRPRLAAWDGKQITLALGGNEGWIADGSKTGRKKQYTEIRSFGKTNRWTVGSCDGWRWENLAGDERADCDFHGVRFYNRVLSEAEIVHNRKVDAIRFREAAFTNVVVASERDRAQGAETNGVYEVAGRWTFTADAVETMDGGVRTVYEPAGYTLEEMGEDGEWGAKTSHGGAEWEYVAEPGRRPVRLTWRWRSRSAKFIVIIR